MRKNLIDAITEDLKKEKYPFQIVSNMKLKRSVIPQAESTRLITQFDNATALALHFTAGKLGVTTDELIRRIIWLNLN